MSICLRRREFIAGLGGAAVWPLAARAQQGDRVRRIGVLTQYAEDDPVIRARIAVLRDSLRRLGRVEGRNLRIEIRFAAGDAGRLRPYAAELAALMPDVLITTGIAPLSALQQVTPAIPIVFHRKQRSSRRRFRREHRPPWWQHHRICTLRTGNQREMAGIAQADRAGSDADNLCL
jgi:putative ABC transport system substrate-binding protein